MKCKNCGANYAAREERCPYCGTANPTGALWAHRRKLAEDEYRTTETLVKKKLPLEVADRVATKVLIGLAIAAVLCFLLVIVGAFAVEGGSRLSNRIHKDDLESRMEELYQQERFGELYELMSDKELFGQEYYAYSQMCLVYYDYTRFELARMELLQSEDQGEALSEWSRQYCLERIFNSGAQILTLDIQTYPSLASENREVYGRYCQDVRTFCRAMLGMSEEEVAALSGDGYYVANEGPDGILPITEENRYLEGDRAYFSGDEPLFLEILEREAWK